MSHRSHAFAWLEGPCGVVAMINGWLSESVDSD